MAYHQARHCYPLLHLVPLNATSNARTCSLVNAKNWKFAMAKMEGTSYIKLAHSTKFLLTSKTKTSTTITHFCSICIVKYSLSHTVDTYFVTITACWIYNFIELYIFSWSFVNLEENMSLTLLLFWVSTWTMTIQGWTLNCKSNLHVSGKVGGIFLQVFGILPLHDQNFIMEVIPDIIVCYCKLKYAHLIFVYQMKIFVYKKRKLMLMNNL